MMCSPIFERGTSEKQLGHKMRVSVATDLFVSSFLLSSSTTTAVVFGS